MLRIGLIDSGVGGFSILNAFLETPVLTDTTFLYVADSGHLPYGLKSDSYIHERMEKITVFLISQKIDVLVIACNTATAVSAEKLRNKYLHLPIIAIEPAIKPAALATKTGHIAVAATQSTLESDRLNQLIAQFAQHCTVHKVVGSTWVELVEAQKITPDSDISPLEESLALFQQYPIDQLVLGCTHFPFLSPVLHTLLPSSVTMIDPAHSIVQACYNRILSDRNLLTHNLQEATSTQHKSMNVELYTTGNIESFTQQTQLLKLQDATTTIFPLSV